MFILMNPIVPYPPATVSPGNHLLADTRVGVFRVETLASGDPRIKRFAEIQCTSVCLVMSTSFTMVLASEFGLVFEEHVVCKDYQLLFCMSCFTPDRIFLLKAQLPLIGIIKDKHKCDNVFQ